MADFFSKQYAQKHYTDEIVYNPGLPFLHDVVPGFFVSGIVLILLGFFLYLYVGHTTYRFSFSLALIIGGAVGNIIDRFDDGVVTDWLSTGFGNVVNGADIAIMCGMVLLLVSSFKHL